MRGTTVVHSLEQLDHVLVIQTGRVQVINVDDVSMMTPVAVVVVLVNVVEVSTMVLAVAVLMVDVSVAVTLVVTVVTKLESVAVLASAKDISCIEMISINRNISSGSC